MPEPTSTTGIIASLLASNEGAGKLSFVIAGLAGGIISMQFIEAMSLKQRVAAVATSIVLADQFAQPLSNLLGAADYAFGAAGMIGLFGFSATGAIIKGIKDANLAGMLQEFISSIAARISGRK